MIAEALSSVPQLDMSTFEKMFTNNIQDILMIYYLAELTRKEIIISDIMNSK